VFEPLTLTRSTPI